MREGQSMIDNRTTELLDGLRHVGNLHEFAELFGFDWYGDDDWTWHDVAVKMADDFEQAIAATLASDASAVRLAERLRSIADEMRHVGASTMTPHELLAFYASEVDKVADSLMFATTLGSGTCEIVATSTNNLMYPDYMTKWYELSCGHSLTLKDEEEPKRCAVCGKKVDFKALDRRLIATYLQRSELNHVIAERDEWKAKCETREFAYKQADAERKRYSEQIDELLAERDEWKAKLAELRAYKDMDSNTLDSRM